MLTVLRSTVFGEVLAHALKLGENSIFDGLLRVARRQIGCLRFCSYVAGSRTPRRFACQPDLAELTAAAGLGDGESKAAEGASPRAGAAALPQHALRLARLRPARRRHCAEEIRRGADDESEMGVFHDLFEPQRAANLRARLDEYTPAGVDAGLIFADQEAP